MTYLHAALALPLRGGHCVIPDLEFSIWMWNSNPGFRFLIYAHQFPHCENVTLHGFFHLVPKRDRRYAE
jgi:hypothetical protein